MHIISGSDKATYLEENSVEAGSMRSYFTSVIKEVFYEKVT